MAIFIKKKKSTLLLPLFPGPLSPVKVPSLGQIDLLKNYSYSIVPCVKNIKKHKKYKYECDSLTLGIK